MSTEDKSPDNKPPVSTGGQRRDPGAVLFEQPPPSSTGSRAVIYILVALVIIAAAVGVWYWRHRSAAPAADEAANVVVSVQVATAERKQIAATASAVGNISPRLQATVSPKIGGQIAQMALLRNTPVKEGQVIAVLETRDLQAQRSEAAAAYAEAVASLRSLSGGSIPQQNAAAEKDLRDAQANVNNAQALYDRRLALFQRGGISQKDVETAQLSLTTAKDQLKLAEQTIELRTTVMNPNDRQQAEQKAKQAQERLVGLDAQLSYATIRAPYPGTVTDQFQYKGEYVAAGAKLVNIADMSEVIVKAPFADTVVTQLKAGDPANVLPADLAGEQLPGKVTLVSRSADPANRTVEVWVSLPNRAGRMRANSAAQVVIETKSVPDAVVVPAAAVTLDASNTNTGTVMVVDDKSIANATKVTVGIRQGDEYQIESGLQGGETVVVSGNYALPDKTKVEIAKPGEEGGDEADSKDKDAGDKAGDKAPDKSDAGGGNPPDKAGSKGSGDKPADKTSGDKPADKAPADKTGDKPSGGNSGGKPAGDKPGGNPAGKPGGNSGGNAGGSAGDKGGGKADAAKGGKP